MLMDPILCFACCSPVTGSNYFNFALLARRTPRPAAAPAKVSSVPPPVAGCLCPPRERAGWAVVIQHWPSLDVRAERWIRRRRPAWTGRFVPLLLSPLLDLVLLSFFPCELMTSPSCAWLPEHGRPFAIRVFNLLPSRLYLGSCKPASCFAQLWYVYSFHYLNWIQPNESCGDNGLFQQGVPLCCDFLCVKSQKQMDGI